MDDWDTVTKIGSKTRGGGGGPRENVVRGKSALNAARRTGAVIATEKKYGAGNSATKAAVEGQRQTKVDGSNDIMKPKLIGKALGMVIQQHRDKMVPKMTQKDLANLCGITLPRMIEFENGKAACDQGKLALMERHLHVKLRGKDIGSATVPSNKPPKKDVKS